jgi:peptidoglycan DL-endopeptidase CwlO
MPPRSHTRWNARSTAGSLGRLRLRDPRSVRLLLCLLAAVVLSVVAAAGARPASNPVSKAQITAKAAQAQAVLAQVQAINVQLGRNAEAYDGARFQLQTLDGRVAVNRKLLAQARRDYETAQRNAQELLVRLYTDEQPQWLDIVVGATSFSDLLDRIDTAQTVATNDAAVAAQIARTKATLQRRERALARQERRQRGLVARLAAQRAAIQGQLAQRQRLLASIQSEVEALRAERHRQELALAAAARRRVAAQLAAEQQAARQRAAAEAAARRRAAAPKTPPAPATSTPTTTAAQAAPPTQPAAPTTTAPPRQAPPPRHTAPPPSSPGSGHPEAASIALRYLGVPYRWGGASPSGFDCSGLVMYVYAQLGISLPHFAAAQYGMGSPVSRGDLQPGDLVFFDGLNHVGIYIGGNQFVHAPHTGDVVRVSTLTGWFASTYVGARRI